MSTREGATLTEHQSKAKTASRLQLLANADYLGGLAALTISCTRDSGWLERGMNGIFTYENPAFSGQSMHLCSNRRTHYCSLGRSISSCDRGPGMAAAKYAACKSWRTALCSPYPARQARAESKRMVGAEPTEGLHVREGHPGAGLRRAAGRGISVGFGQAFSGGRPKRERNDGSERWRATAAVICRRE